MKRNEKVQLATLVAFLLSSLALGFAQTQAGTAAAGDSSALQKPANPCNPCEKKPPNPCNPCAKKAQKSNHSGHAPATSASLTSSVGDDDERPVHTVTLSPFSMQSAEVTNQQFAQFAEATGYTTDAEKKGFSGVFKRGQKGWEVVQGADWRHPLGPDSSIADKQEGKS